MKELQKDLVSLDKILEYVVIRNYEFLFGEEDCPSPLDVDIFVQTLTKSDQDRIKKLGYFIMYTSKYRIVFAKQIKGSLVLLDIHKVHLTGNSVSHKVESNLLSNRKYKEGVPVLEDEYYLATLLLREIISEGFKLKYRAKLNELFAISKKKKVSKILSKAIGKKDSLKVLAALNHYDFERLKSLRRKIKIKFILKNNLSYLKTALSLRPNKPKTVAVIGMDGSGKTTVVNRSFSVLQLSGIRVKKLYLGRGKRNVLPVQKPAKLIKDRSMNLPNSVKSMIYSVGALVYTVDFLIRHLISRNRKYGILLSDRFSSDILLMPHVPRALRRTLYGFLPKADVYVYLHDDISVLRKRKGHNLKDLKRQQQEFKWVNSVLHPVKIRNQNLDITVNEVLKLSLSV